MKNIDVIRKMPAKELAGIIMCPYDGEFEFDCEKGKCPKNDNCNDCCREWLESEAES